MQSCHLEILLGLTLAINLLLQFLVDFLHHLNAHIL